MRKVFFAVAIIALFLACSNAGRESDALINDPFRFAILKNYSDDFSSIGTVLDSSSSCPLRKENIADPAFCFMRTVKYDGLEIHVFSFDVLQSGTAEYIVTGDSVSLRNGLMVGSARKDVLGKMGRPYKIRGDEYVWRSSDAHNFLVFTIAGDRVAKIRWHEERQPEYKGIVVWETKYE